MTLQTNLVERSAERILADEFMVARAKILELAATLDRLDRASGNIEDSKPMQLLMQGIHVLIEDEPEKAKRVQLLMSRQYDPNWQKNLSVSKRGN